MPEPTTASANQEDSAMPLHPDFEAFLELANAQPQPMSAMSPEQARAAYARETRCYQNRQSRRPGGGSACACEGAGFAAR